MTNFDKVKKLWEFDDLLSFQTQICDVIRQTRGTGWGACMDEDCANCYKWLQEEYRENDQRYNI